MDDVLVYAAKDGSRDRLLVRDALKKCPVCDVLRPLSMFLVTMEERADGTGRDFIVQDRCAKCEAGPPPPLPVPPGVNHG